MHYGQFNHPAESRPDGEGRGEERRGEEKRGEGRLAMPEEWSRVEWGQDPTQRPGGVGRQQQEAIARPGYGICLTRLYSKMMPSLVEGEYLSLQKHYTRTHAHMHKQTHNTHTEGETGTTQSIHM